MRRALKQEVAKPVKTLRQVCIERGIDPDNTGVKSTKQRLLVIDRIIPGVPDRISPTEQLRQRGDPRPERARRMYTRTSAAKDAAYIAGSHEPIAAYVNEFCRLNNLTVGA